MSEICLIILIMWGILFGGNAPSLKVNKKPELDNYIAMIHLRVYYGREKTSFDSNWDEWEEDGLYGLRVIRTNIPILYNKPVWKESGLHIKM